MNEKIKKAIQLLLFIALGVVLFYLVYKDFDFAILFSELKSLNYWWFVLMYLFSILSQISRSMRWQMLLDTDGDKTRFNNTFMAVSNAYFANIAFPRLGEITRCAIVSKYDNIKFSKVLGTMVTERLIDVLVLSLMTILAFSFQLDVILKFFSNNPDFGSKLNFIFSFKFIFIAILLLLVAVFFIFNIAKGKYNRYKIFEKLSAFINNFWQGLISLKKIKNKPLFIFHSLFIWVLYFLMFYVCFFAFQGFESLDIWAALMLFVAGSFGMVAPAPNGIGAYHFMIIQTLIIYGIAYDKAASFALIVHGLQTIELIILGLISFVVIPIINRSSK